MNTRRLARHAAVNVGSRAGSACIDAGSVNGAPLDDFDGDRRDANPDIGPDEYVATPAR